MFEKFLEEISDIPHLIWIGIVLIGALIFHRLINITLNKSIKLWSERLKLDATKFRFMQHFLVFVIYFSAVILIGYSIPTIRTAILSLLAGAGIAAAAIAFASQQAIANMINGLFIVFFEPFRVNDRIRINNNEYFGIVEDITMRHTVIRDFENNRIVIPNSVIANAIISNLNLEDERVFRKLIFRISLEADIQKAKDIIHDVCYKHPLRIDTRTEEEKNSSTPEVPVRVSGFDDKGITLEAFASAANPTNAYIMACEIYEEVLKTFQKNNIHLVKALV
ncbi:MAG: mechanosensitive ion channel protein MscS [Bacteroidia bacterium]|nr:MAG: mechanosensitive ion channel protein MscS [Bacteroidia bacterium]